MGKDYIDYIEDLDFYLSGEDEDEEENEDEEEVEEESDINL